VALPDSFRWADASDGSSNLYLRYGCVASIKPDGTMKLKYWQKEFQAKAASVAQAKRFVERWILAQSSPRAHECRQWRNRHFRSHRPIPSTREDPTYASLCATQASRRS
jgi:hypothetical protein